MGNKYYNHFKVYLLRKGCNSIISLGNSEEEAIELNNIIDTDEIEVILGRSYFIFLLLIDLIRSFSSIF